MKIGIDASRANKEHKTGTEWYSYYLIRWLAKLDDKNEYILYTDKPLTKGLLDLSSDQYYLNNKEEEHGFDKKGCQIIKSKHNNFKAKVLKSPCKYFWTQLRLSLEMLFNRVDVLFIPSHTLPIIHPKNSLVTLHDIGFEVNTSLYDSELIISGGIGRLINRVIKIFTFGKYGASAIDYLRWSTNYALRKAKKIISVSNFSKQEIVDIYNIDSSKISVVHNGYNKFLYKKNTDLDYEKEILTQYGIEKPYFFYVGRIEKKKNIPRLIDCFAQIKTKDESIKEKLVLVGDASFGYDETKYIITSFDMNNEVVMPGWVRECHLPIIYSGATAFVFPSNYEGFGIPLLQAMACEVPIIASKSSSIPEVVADAAILVDPDDTDAIIDSLRNIATNEKLREELINKGKKRIQKFSWEITAINTLKVINSFAKKE
jgi:glycosyltransferase involved in cell wall biosynthesis